MQATFDLKLCFCKERVKIQPFVFCPYTTSIADEKDPKLCVFTGVIAGVAKKYLVRNVQIARLCVCSNKETNRVLQRRVYSEQRSRANLLHIQNTNISQISGKRTHLFVKSRKFLAFFAARRNTCRIPRFPEDIVILSTFILSHPKLECGVQIIVANNNILKFKSHWV